MLFPIALEFHIANNVCVTMISLLLPTASPVTPNLRSRTKLMAHVCSFLTYYTFNDTLDLRIFFAVQYVKYNFLYFFYAK